MLSTPTKIIGATLALGLGGWLLFGFFGIQALFMDRIVNEEIPNVVTNSALEVTITPETSTTSTSKTETQVFLPPKTPLPQPPPLSTPRILARGSFQQGDSTYTIQGNATITEKDSVRTLSLTNFDVTNGPDLFVYAVKADSAENLTVKDAVRKAQFVNLGALKGNRGNQTYQLPPEIKLDDTTLITIWCRRFSRHFGSASLQLMP